MKKLNLIYLLLPIVLFSCGGGADEDPLPLPTDSSFTASVSGDVTSSFNGEAEFVHGIIKSQPAGQNGSNLIIGLENKNNLGEFIALSVFEIDNTTGIKEGTYNYVPLSTSNLVQGIYTNEDTDAFYLLPVEGTTNQIIITSITDTRVKGSYNFTISGILGGEITMTGTFDALGVTTTN